MSVWLASAGSSGGGSGIGLLVTVVGLTIGAALVIAWIIGRLPEKEDPFVFPRRRRKDPFADPPGGPANPPPRGPFDS